MDACEHDLLSGAQMGGETVCMQFLMVVISKMAHKVDLGLAERQISQSLYSRMLRQEYAVCASVE